MSFLIRQIEATAGGRSITRDRAVAKPELTLGRSADNDIALPDLALDPVHARIALDAQGKVRVDAAGTLGFYLDGANTRVATIDPTSGGELRFGSYRVTVAAAPGGAVLLTVQAIESSAGATIDPKAGFTLRHALPSKRAVSWLLALFILGFFLALPITSHLTRGPDPKARVLGDASWDPGPLSQAHHGLQGNCAACHVKPFEAVRDASCKGCHAQVHDHADPARLASARADLPWGQRITWRIAHAFGKPGPGACVDCHTEHQGAGAMAAPRQQFCADCHGSLKDRLRDTRLGNAADFGTLHPQFSPAVVSDRFTGKLSRVSLDSHPHEDSGLFFPHRMHLDPRGGVARMAVSLGAAQGYGSGLKCSNCHRPTEDGVRFKPVEMERDCESCHSLAYDKVGTTFRTLRHGNIDQMVADLGAADRVGHPLVSGRMRPGEFAVGGPYYATFSAPPAGIGSLQRALSRGGVCGECHTALWRNGKPGVVPVTQVSRYMDHGWFDHNAHRQTQCTSCHAARSSSSASDVLLPKIAQCRTCHMGEDASRAAVPSSCAMCHAYHPSPLIGTMRRRTRR